MKPEKIFVLRHAQSEGNVDKTVYARKPDYALNLTPIGVIQANSAGIRLKAHKAMGKFAVYYSPFFRSIQTLNNVVVGLGKDNIDRNYIREDPRIREQEWHGAMPESDYNEDKSDVMERECFEYGKFYYRFDGGESSADVYDRVSDFLNTLNRDFEKNDFPNNVLLVTHGMTMRVFMHRWFHKTVADFHTWKNPHNCQYFTLTLNKNTNKYEFDFDIIEKYTINHNQYHCDLNI